MSDENQFPDADEQEQAGLNRRVYQEGVDIEQTGESIPPHPTEASGTPSDVEQEIRRLRGY